MVTDVTKFHKSHLGVRGRLEYVCACVQSFILDFDYWEGGS